MHYAGGTPVCAISHGCATVQQSEYAELGGVPVALLGLAGYVAILASLARDGEAARTATAFLALAGFGFSGWLTYVEVARLDAICIWCVGSAVCMTLLAALSVTRMLGAPPPGPRGEREDGRGGRRADPVGSAVRPAGECTQPRATASSTAHPSASRSGAPSRACSASSVAGPPRRARRLARVDRGHRTMAKPV